MTIIIYPTGNSSKVMEENSHVTSMRSQVVMVGALFSIRFIGMGVIKTCFGVLLDGLVFQLNSDLGKMGMIIASYHGIACLLGEDLLWPVIKYNNNNNDRFLENA